MEGFRRQGREAFEEISACNFKEEMKLIYSPAELREITEKALARQLIEDCLSINTAIHDAAISGKYFVDVNVPYQPKLIIEEYQKLGFAVRKKTFNGCVISEIEISWD